MSYGKGKGHPRNHTLLSGAGFVLEACVSKCCTILVLISTMSTLLKTTRQLY